MKIFLSHSSKDKHIVSAVANRLGRSYIVYDDFSFDTAVDFETSIDRGLDASELFVLFASRNSMRSDWVRKELSQAQALKLAGKIDSIAAVIIDDLPIDDLPDWLRKARVVSLSSVASITREIQYLFQRRLSQKQSPYFVGRQSEIEEAESILSPTSSLEEPHVFSFFGLEGVGRKTLCKHVCTNLLSLPKSQMFRIQDGDSLADLVIKMEEDINPSLSIAATKARISALERTSSRDLSTIFERLAKAFVDARELLILQDDGGLLDNDGFVKHEFVDMIDVARNNEAIRLAIISRRKFRFPPAERGFPCISVGPLKEDDAKRLILRQFRGSKLAITDQQANELAPYVGGYPPSISLIIELCRQRGIAHLIADKSQLIEFTAVTMLKLLEKYADLTDLQKEILVFLAYYSPAPLQAIGDVVGLPSDELNRELGYLFDCALVVPDGEFYRLADPLVNAVLRSYGRNWSAHDRAVIALESYLDTIDDDRSKLLIARSLFRAMNYSGNRAAGQKAISLTADIVDLSQHYYHERRYDESVEFSRLALERQPANVEVRSYLVRGLIQLEMYPEAEEEIRNLERLGHRRDYWFLKGFLARKRYRYREAISAYNESVAAGRTGAAVHRELAQCYYEEREYRKAMDHLAEASKRDRDNRYVVDLEIQIAIKTGDQKSAEERLTALRLIDDEHFFYHRKSTIEYRFGRLADAYDSAQRAVEGLPRPPFAFLSQLIKCEIATDRLDAAKKGLDDLDQRFRTHHDIRIGLRCKYEIASENWDAALGLWERLREKERPIHLWLRYGAISGKVLTKTADETLLRQYTVLKDKLSSFDPDLLDQELGAASTERG